MKLREFQVTRVTTTRTRFYVKAESEEQVEELLREEGPKELVAAALEAETQAEYLYEDDSDEIEAVDHEEEEPS